MFNDLDFQMFQCSNVQMFQCQMSNVNKVKLLSERTSGVPPVKVIRASFILMHLFCCTDANALLISVMMVVGMLGMVGFLVVVVVDQDLYLDQLANLSSAFCSSLNCH